ncbi:MAG: sulfite exporter TauE/SafE family protein [Armatimonadetes bacterium]|nr:sulfite exporter TauE/SafE family protein [Armatimonadota bacterium]
MTYAPIYGLALAWGLAGGFSHCIGMCGVFVVSYAGMPGRGAPRRFVHLERHILFHGGRLLSLAALGLVGGALGDLTRRWASAQGLLSVAAGVTLLGLALGFAGILPRFKIPEPDVLGTGGGRGRRLFLRVLQSRHALRPLLIGLFVGLLPCGLTYQALIPAALTRSPWAGAATMLCFGLGTVPGLLTLGLFGNALFGGLLMNLKFRRAMTGVAAALMAVMGLAFLWRGLPNI